MKMWISKKELQSLRENNSELRESNEKLIEIIKELKTEMKASRLLRGIVGDLCSGSFDYKVMLDSNEIVEIVSGSGKVRAVPQDGN